MTARAQTTQAFLAKHEDGSEWRLAANCKRGVDHMNKLAANFARNYCKKHRKPGLVALKNEVSGDEFTVAICDLYTVKSI